MKNDSILADKFGFCIEGTTFMNPDSLIHLSESLLNPHTLLAGASNAPQIETITLNSTCSIQSKLGTVITHLPKDMEDHVLGLPSTERIFALSIDGRAGELDGCKGRIVAIADSGFIGSKGTEKPGRGLIEEGDNLLFIEYILQWLTA